MIGRAANAVDVERIEMKVMIGARTVRNALAVA
jgi:hypothetical protein